MKHTEGQKRQALQTTLNCEMLCFHKTCLVVFFFLGLTDALKYILIHFLQAINMYRAVGAALTEPLEL